MKLINNVCDEKIAIFLKKTKIQEQLQHTPKTYKNDLHIYKGHKPLIDIVIIRSPILLAYTAIKIKDGPKNFFEYIE